MKSKRGDTVQKKQKCQVGYKLKTVTFVIKMKIKSELTIRYPVTLR